jgi:restriction system protein
VTIIETALKVLKTENRPLTAEEIYGLIRTRNLYSFGAKDPLSIVRAELRRHSVGFTGKTKATNSKVKEDLQKRYTPL